MTRPRFLLDCPLATTLKPPTARLGITDRLQDVDLADYVVVVDLTTTTLKAKWTYQPQQPPSALRTVLT